MSNSRRRKERAYFKFPPLVSPVSAKDYSFFALILEYAGALGVTPGRNLVY